MRLILISLDACFTKDSEKLLKLPNLKKLAEGGVFCDNVQTVYPSLTYPIHVSIATGCYPNKHGIGHNHIFDAAKRHNERKWHWESKEIKKKTIFKAAKESGKTVATLLWPVIGKDRDVKYCFSEVLALKGENQVLKVMKYSSLPWLLRCELKYGKTREKAEQPYIDDFSTRLAQSLIERKTAKKCPDVLALHLTNVDTMRHNYGTYSPEAVDDGFKRLDRNVGLVLESLEKEGLMEDSLICVVSDHGHDDIKYKTCINTFFKRDNIKAVAQSLGMGSYIRLDIKDYDEVLNYLKSNMEELKISKVYENNELRKLKCDDEILLAVEAMPNTEITDDEDDELPKANHGFGMEHEGAKVLLWFYGKIFKKGVRLQSANVVDIAPTLARALNLNLGEIDGKVIAEAFV